MLITDILWAIIQRDIQQNDECHGFVQHSVAIAAADKDLSASIQRKSESAL